MKESKSIIFTDYFPKLFNNDKCKGCMLGISSLGEIFLYPIANDFHDYIIPEYKEQKAGWISQTDQKVSSELFKQFFETDILSYTRETRPFCISILQFTPNCHIETNPMLDMLLITGVLKSDIPYFCVYLVKEKHLTEIYSETLVGIWSGCVIQESIVMVLPRTLQTTIFGFPLQFLPDHTRFIPQIYILDSPTKRSDHITCGHGPWAFITWSDQNPTPFIQLWRLSQNSTQWMPLVPETQFSTVFMDILIPGMIEGVSLDPNGKFIGFILHEGENHYICVWDISTPRPLQFNILCPDFPDTITRAGWYQSLSKERKIRYCVSFGNGEQYEHIGNTVERWVCDNEVPEHSISFDDGLFYIGRNGEPRFKTNPSIKNENCIAQLQAPFPINKITTIGKINVVKALHMRRCANCKKPLLHPLVSKADGKCNYYCSSACQRAHWPTFIAVTSDFRLQNQL